jgi:RNA polymerase sigma-54 factor
MALEQKLSLKLSQQLVMTPSLQQAIKLLQMTRLELETVLTQELVENPVLEERDEIVEASDESEDQEESPDPMDEIDIEAYFREQWESSGAGPPPEAREPVPLENTLSREPDLYDHLLWQLHLTEVSELLREIAELIIGNLEPDGFLVATLEEIQALGGEGRDDSPSRGRVLGYAPAPSIPSHSSRIRRAHGVPGAGCGADSGPGDSTG